MARKADEDLLAELDSLGIEEPQTTPAAAVPAKSSKKPTTPAATTNDDDPLADLEKQLAEKPATAPTSRPATPRVAATSTPAQVRTSGDTSRSFHQGVSAGDETKASSAEESAPAAASGGWWGSSLFSAASAAVKQAETLAKEISGHEEAQRWAEQVRGNMRGLQEFGTDLRSRALPTFSSIISHIAPPISAHERLQIHTTHDIQGYPSLDPLIYAPFARIMAQVEGGDLVVLQRSSSADLRDRNASNKGDDANLGYRGRILGGSTPSWSESGPWWRDSALPRSLGAVPGLREGTRLARVSAESSAKDFFAARGGIDEARKAAAEDSNIDSANPVRTSDIFLAVQAIRYTVDTDLFAAAAGEGDEKSDEKDDADAEVVVFAVYLYDPFHKLAFHSLSQSLPARWISWLDHHDGAGGEELPASIQEIVRLGGVDPRDWVAEWLEESLSLAVGVVAQRYVARRMGVGESEAPAAVAGGKEEAGGEVSVTA